MAFEVIQQVLCDRQGEVLNDGNKEVIPVFLLKAQIIEATINTKTGEITEGNPVKEIGMNPDEPFMICEKCKEVCEKYFDANLKTQGGPKFRAPRKPRKKKEAVVDEAPKAPKAPAKTPESADIKK